MKILFFCTTFDRNQSQEPENSNITSQYDILSVLKLSNTDTQVVELSRILQFRDLDNYWFGFQFRPFQLWEI